VSYERVLAVTTGLANGIIHHFEVDKAVCLQYMEQTWIINSLWSPVTISVYQQQVRTNKDLEGWSQQRCSSGLLVHLLHSEVQWHCSCTCRLTALHTGFVTSAGCASALDPTLKSIDSSAGSTATAISNVTWSLGSFHVSVSSSFPSIFSSSSLQTFVDYYTGNGLSSQSSRPTSASVSLSSLTATNAMGGKTWNIVSL